MPQKPPWEAARPEFEKIEKMAPSGIHSKEIVFFGFFDSGTFWWSQGQFQAKNRPNRHPAGQYDFCLKNRPGRPHDQNSEKSKKWRRPEVTRKKSYFFVFSIRALFGGPRANFRPKKGPKVDWGSPCLPKKSVFCRFRYSAGGRPPFFISDFDSYV